VAGQLAFARTCSSILVHTKPVGPLTSAVDEGRGLGVGIAAGEVDGASIWAQRGTLRASLWPRVSSR
jgi:hypothetical protein